MMNKAYTWLAIYIFAILLALLVLTACSPMKKAVQTFDKHLPDAAEYCADRFPAKDTIIVRDSIRLDTIYQDGEVVEVLVPSNPDTVLVKAQCPPHKIIVKTVRHDSIIIRVDKAMETALRFQNEACNEELIKITTSRDELKARMKGKVLIPWWILLVAGLLTGGFIFLRIKKIISPIKI
jgi:predicted small secreted protein